MLFPFLCSPVIREWSCKKSPTEKKRALEVVLNDLVSDFETLLHKSRDISSHYRNIQMLLTELY